MMILGEHDDHIDNGRCTAIFNEMRNVKHKKHIVLGPSSFVKIADAHHYMISEQRSYEAVAKEAAIFLARVHDNINIKK